MALCVLSDDTGKAADEKDDANGGDDDEDEEDDEEEEMEEEEEEDSGPRDEAISLLGPLVVNNSCKGLAEKNPGLALGSSLARVPTTSSNS